MNKKALAKSYLKSKLYKLAAVAISDRAFIRWQYQRETGRTLDLAHPATFNEKLQWLKLNCRNDIYRRCADKYEVREYVTEVLGAHLLNELYAVYDRPGEIDLNHLPDACVLKLTHGSGQNVIITDKSKVDPRELRWLLRYYFGANHYFVGREWAYRNITPRIVCEKYLDDGGASPKDYKIFCFDGEPRIIQVDFDRFSDHKRNLYDLDWRLLPCEYLYRIKAEEVRRPEDLDTMLEYARRLAHGFPFVRVDLYCLAHRIVFGEMAFYPEKGTGEFRPESYDLLLGSYLKLPGK